jgi:dimethylargininase
MEPRPAGPHLVALTRAVSPDLAQCALTHVPRTAIDLDVACVQHEAYERLLADLGCTVLRLPADAAMPDSVFIEDTAVVLDEVAVVTRPGAASRRGETSAVAEALAAHRIVHTIAPPGTLDGGDVLRVGRRLFVGASGRTNAEGIAQLRAFVGRYGYTVEAVPVHGCLHLKTAVTEVAEGVLLMNPAWVDPLPFAGFERIVVHPAEPFAANALRVGEAVVYPAHVPQTQECLTRRGLNVRTVPADELAKAEGGVTCCSLLFTV